MSSPRQGLGPPHRLTKEQCWTVPPCSYLHQRPAFGPSCNEFVYPGCWHFDNGAISISKFDDVLLEHGGLPHVLPLAVHLSSWTSKGDNSEPFLLFEFFGGTPPSCLKVVGGWWPTGF